MKQNPHAEKTEVMAIGRTDPGQNIQVEGKKKTEVTEFCYPGSIQTHDDICDKDMSTILGKANANLGRLKIFVKTNH